MFINKKKFNDVSFKKFKNLRSCCSANIRKYKLSIGIRGSSGRSNKGKIVVRTKGSVKPNMKYNIMSNTFKCFKYTSTSVQIRSDSTKTGLIGLFVNSLGCWYNSLLPQNILIFDYMKIFNFEQGRKVQQVSRFWPRQVVDMPPHSKLCSIEAINHLGHSSGIKFIKSAGSRGLLLDNRYKEILSLIVLPSSSVKVFSNKSLAFFNHIQNDLYMYLKPGKAGYYIKNGRKPTTRGVVKNPCDHPNGGRTRTLLLSRTPWGRVAKKSRKPRINVNLKILAKRSPKLLSELDYKHRHKQISEQNEIVVKGIKDSVLTKI